MEEFDFFEQEDKSNNSSLIDPKLVLIKVSRAWSVLLVTVLISVLATFIFHRYTSEKFRLTATLLIPEENTGSAAGLAELLSVSTTNNFLNELEFLRSERIIKQAIRNLQFNTEYFSKGRVKTIEEYKSLPYYVVVTEGRKLLEDKMFKISFSQNNAFKLTLDSDENHEDSRSYLPYEDISLLEGKLRIEFTRTANLEGEINYFQFRSEEGLLEEWENKLSVTYLKAFTSIASLTLTHTQPQKAADFLNEIMLAYMDSELDQKNSAIQKRIAYIDKEMKALDDTLRLYGGQLDRFKLTNRVTDFDQMGNNLINRINDLEVEKSLNHRAISSLIENLKYLQDTSLIDQVFNPVSLEGETELQRFVNRLQQLLVERNELLLTLEPFNDLVVNNNLEITQLTKLLQNSLTLKIDELKSKNQTIMTELSSLDSEFRQYPQSKREYGDIQRIFDMYDGMFQFWRQRKAEAGILKASNEANSRIVDEANPNVAPFFPNRPMNYAIGAGLGLVIPILFLVIRELLNDKIEFRKQVEAITNIPIIGMIGHNKYEGNLAVLEHPKSIMSESFRSIRSNLSFFGKGNTIKTILITSNASGEGKSFCSLNTASMMAISGKKTVLVGLDLRKPKLFQTLDCPMISVFQITWPVLYLKIKSFNIRLMRI